jgi:hypothetical protein
VSVAELTNYFFSATSINARQSPGGGIRRSRIRTIITIRKIAGATKGRVQIFLIRIVFKVIIKRNPSSKFELREVSLSGCFTALAISGFAAKWIT